MQVLTVEEVVRNVLRNKAINTELNCTIYNALVSAHDDPWNDIERSKLFRAVSDGVYFANAELDLVIEALGRCTFKDMI